MVPLTNIILTRKFKKKNPTINNKHKTKKKLENFFEFLKKIEEKKCLAHPTTTSKKEIIFTRGKPPRCQTFFQDPDHI